MTQNTEQNVRTRDEQAVTLAFEIALWGKSNLHERSVVAVKNLREAEARGAAEQRRKDAELSRAKLFCQNEQEASDRTPERPDVVQWQKERNEFFLSSTLEVVTEYAAWRDKKDAEGQLKLWIAKSDFLSLTDVDDGCDALHQCATVSRDCCKLLPDDVPLYTRPANVAALEAENEALKIPRAHSDGVRNEKQKRINTLEAEIASLKEAEQLARADAARFAWVVENTGCFWYGLPGFGPVSGRSCADRMKDLRSAIDKNMARAALTREGGV